ncbi:hypothetical protein BJY01DRAFT_147756 [Aspergillus pseudoustus]|uniref:Uncharacterized protein n=1 Tax=Aspergillus pseudoustus TaxID=1810923 RepID=A0ABR4IF35_9EURO
MERASQGATDPANARNPTFTSGLLRSRTASFSFKFENLDMLTDRTRTLFLHHREQPKYSKKKLEDDRARGKGRKDATRSHVHPSQSLRPLCGSASRSTSFLLIEVNESHRGSAGVHRRLAAANPKEEGGRVAVKKSSSARLISADVHRQSDETVGMIWNSSRLMT